MESHARSQMERVLNSFQYLPWKLAQCVWGYLKIKATLNPVYLLSGTNNPTLEMQGDQENYLHFIRITMCEQEQMMILELGRVRRIEREMSQFITHMAQSSDQFYYRRNCLKFVFPSMCIGYCRGYASYLWLPSIRFKVFLYLGKCTGYETSVE